MLKLAALFTKSANDTPDKKDQARAETMRQTANRGHTYDDATTQAWGVLIKSGPVFMLFWHHLKDIRRHMAASFGMVGNDRFPPKIARKISLLCIRPQRQVQ